MSLKWTRADFPALQARRDPLPPLYFDNSTVTLVPEPVLESMAEYYREYPGTARSTYRFANETQIRLARVREQAGPT